MEHILSDIHLFSHLGDLVFTILIEDDDIIDIGTVADIFCILKACADKSLLTVYVQFFVCLNDLCCLDSVEVTYLSQSRMVCAIFLLQMFKPFACYVNHPSEVLLYLCYLRLYLCYQFVSLVL